MLINIHPLICFQDSVLSAKECEHIIKLAEPHMTRATVMTDENGGLHASRTGNFHFIKKGEDTIVDTVYRRVSTLCGMPLEWGEAMQVISYDQTQEYAPHFDTFELKHMPEQEARGGQRILTALCYLNTPMSGGGTTFPELNRTIDAKQGRMVVFQNTFNGGTVRHPWSKHGGDPVGMGIKWACNIWFRESTFK